MQPLVSICITTYCHEKYLRKTLEGILAQKVDFPYEILIHDDCSPDGTVPIISEYARKYPAIVKPLFEGENQYSKGIPINETFNFPRAEGKYIALCEGDDCWIDPGKLKGQISYLQDHPGCTFCFTNGTIHDERGTRPDRPFLPQRPGDEAILAGGSKDLQLADMLRLNFIPTASFVFPRATLGSLPDSFRLHMCEHGDMRMKLFLTAAGYARYEAINAVLYRENVPTSAFQVWSREKRDKVYRRAETVVRLLDDIDEYSEGAALRACEESRREWLTKMAHNAPDWFTLHKGRLGEQLRRLPPKERLRCELRLLLPERLAAKAAKIWKK